MREIYRSGVTPQQKIVAVNQKFGNTDIKNQQGTSRIIYDTLPVDSNTRTLRFFEDSSSRVFPFSNTGSDGNKLGVGDTMVLQSIMLIVWQYNSATGSWDLIKTYDDFSSLSRVSYINFQIANNQVIKKLALSELSPFFNKDYSNSNHALDLQTQIVIPPLLPYILELQVPGNVFSDPVGEKQQYVECQIIGTGGIIAPRTTF